MVVKYDFSSMIVPIIYDGGSNHIFILSDGTFLPLYYDGMKSGGHSLSEAVKVLSDILTVASTTREAKKENDLEGIVAALKRRLQIGMQNLVHFRNVDGSFSEPFDNGRKIG